MVFEGGIHGRCLLLGAEMAAAGGLEIRLAYFCIIGLYDAAFGVAGVGLFAELECGDVGFVGVEQVLGEFGGFAEADGEEAGGEGVEYAGVSGFCRAVETAYLLQGGVAGESGGFVEQQDAVEGAVLGFHGRLIVLRFVFSGSLWRDCLKMVGR